MRFLISILLIFSIKLASAQSVEWLKSFEMDGMKFQHYSRITYQNENLLIGVKAIDTISPADYLNEIYLHSIAENGITNWSLYFKPIDSSVCSEIKIFKSFIEDSIAIIVGQCYLSNLSSTNYFYTTINLSTKRINSYNIGSISSYSLSWIAIENGDLILVKSLSANTLELNRINLLSNASRNKILTLPLPTSYFFNHNFYAVRDSVSPENKLIVQLVMMDTNGTVIVSNSFNTNLLVLNNGFSSLGLQFRNGQLFVVGMYESQATNSTIEGNEIDCFLFRIKENSLQESQFFAIRNQFPNSTKSVQELLFDVKDNNTLIIAKIINDNNLRNVHSYLLNDDGIVWSKKLTEPSVNQLHKRFVNANIINSNNYLNTMSTISGDITFLNYNSLGSIIDSFETKLDTNNRSSDVQESFVKFNDNNIYLIGSHVIKTETKPRLYFAKLSIQKTGINQVHTNSIKIYPNPSSTILNVDVDDVKNLALYNALWVKIKSITNMNQLNIEDVPNGIYYLQVITNSNKHYTEKVIVQK